MAVIRLIFIYVFLSNHKILYQIFLHFYNEAIVLLLQLSIQNILFVKNLFYHHQEHDKPELFFFDILFFTTFFLNT